MLQEERERVSKMSSFQDSCVGKKRSAMRIYREEERRKSLGVYLVLNSCVLFTPPHFHGEI